MEAYAGPEGEDGGGVGVGGRITDDMLGMWKLSRVRTRGPSCCAPGCPGCCPGCCPASPPPGSPDSPSPPPPPAPAGEPDGENGEDGEEEGEERVERDDVGLLPCCGFPSNDDTDDEGRPGDGGSHHAPRVAVGRVRRCCRAAAVVAVVIDLPARDSFPERSWRGRIRERTGWERSLPASNNDAPLAFLLPLLPRYRRPGGLPLLWVWVWVWVWLRERGGAVPGLVPRTASKLAAISRARRRRRAFLPSERLIMFIGTPPAPRGTMERRWTVVELEMIMVRAAWLLDTWSNGSHTSQWSNR